MGNVTFYWMILIGFACSLRALPDVIKRLREKREAADVFQLVATIILAVAIICYTVDMILGD